MHEVVDEVDYWEYVQTCVEKIIAHMASGRIDSEESLIHYIDQICLISNPVKAFEAFHRVSPYEWKDHVNDGLLAKFDYDLGQVAINVYHGVVSNDIYSEVTDTEAYRYLTEGAMRMSLNLGNGQRVVFCEYWEYEANFLNLNSTIQLSTIGSKLLRLFQRGENKSHVYILDHEELGLTWISEKIIEAPKKSLAEFNSHLFESLSQKGCPINSLKDIKIQLVDGLSEMLKDESFDPVDYYDLHEFHYVIYFQQDEVIYKGIGFNRNKEFEEACKAISEFAKELCYLNDSSNPN